MCFWAEYLSWELYGLKQATFREPKLDCSCSLIIFNVNSGHLEFIMIGTSDRTGKLTKYSAADFKKEIGKCFWIVRVARYNILKSPQING